MSGALVDICVIDLTRKVAGPYASLLLASQGADVIKLEPPDGDPSRKFGPFPGDEEHSERSGLFLHLNRYKRSVVMDAASTEGAAVRRVWPTTIRVQTRGIVTRRSTRTRATNDR